jgi:hypothetical protein
MDRKLIDNMYPTFNMHYQDDNNNSKFNIKYNDNDYDSHYQNVFSKNPINRHNGKNIKYNRQNNFDNNENILIQNPNNMYKNNKFKNQYNNQYNNQQQYRRDNRGYNASFNTHYNNKQENLYKTNQSGNYVNNFNQQMYNKKNNDDNYNNYNNITKNNDYLTNIKNLLSRFINKHVTLTTFKYTIVEYKYDLEQLNTGKFFVSPNYNGNLCLVVFVKIMNKYYSYSIDKKTLSKNIQNNIDAIKICKLNIRLDESIYDGTILDCTQLNMGNNLQKTFIINDVYMFRGENISEDNIDNKLLNIETFMKIIQKDDIMNDTTFATNKLYELKDIKDLVNIHIQKSQLKNHIKGITFYSQQNHIKLIYLFNNCGKSDKDKKNMVIRSSGIDNNINEEVTAYFRIKKTETPDVYHLYLKKKSIKDGKKFIRLKKYCIAYVPTINVSYFCKDVFNSSDDGDLIIVKCKLNQEKNKWIPFEQAKEKKYPDSYKDIENKYGIINDDNNSGDSF